MSKSIGHLSLDNASGRMYRGPVYIHVKTCMNTQREDSPWKQLRGKTLSWSFISVVFFKV